MAKCGHGPRPCRMPASHASLSCCDTWLHCTFCLSCFGCPWFCSPSGFVLSSPALSSPLHLSNFFQPLLAQPIGQVLLPTVSPPSLTWLFGASPLSIHISLSTAGGLLATKLSFSQRINSSLQCVFFLSGRNSIGFKVITSFLSFRLQYPPNLKMICENLPILLFQLLAPRVSSHFIL